MKNFIFTTGMLILIVMTIGFQLECNQLLGQKQDLKFVADEAAASAGLCLDPYRFGEGELVFDQEKAVAVAEKIVEQNMPGKGVKTELFFVAAGAEGTAVTVKLSWKKLKATSTYEYVTY